MTSALTPLLNQDLGSAAKDWDVLNARLCGAHPMLDSRFVNLLLKYFGDGTEQLCVISTGGSPSTMCIIRARGFGVWSSFLPSQTQVGPALLENIKDAQRIFSALPKIPLQVDYLCQDPSYSAITSLANKSCSRIDHALTISIHVEGGFDNYWAARPKKLIQNIARYRRRALADGISSRFASITSPGEIEAAVDRYSVLEAAGWKGQSGTALGVDNAQGAFYRDVMSSFAMTGQAGVFELWFGDRLAASRLVISNGSMMIMLKTTYDEGLSRYAPGRLLLHDLIQFAFENKLSNSIEFYTDATVDQISWATSQRWIQHISIYRNDNAAQALVLAKGLRQSFTRISAEYKEDDWSVDYYSHPDDFPLAVMNLLEDAEEKNIELGGVWYRNFVQTIYASRESVVFYVLKSGEIPVAILPIQVGDRNFGKTLESISNFYSSIYAPIFLDTLKAKDFARLFKFIKEQHGSISIFRFAPMDPDARSYRILIDALRLTGYIPFSFFCFGNWYLKVVDSWPAYWNSREGILRNTSRRMGRKFQKDGGTLELITGGSEIDRAIEDFQNVYSASWKCQEPYPKFVPGLIRACSDNGWLRLGIARMNGKPVAAEIWIVAHGKAEVYKLAYHEDYKSYSPGKLLTAFLMKHVIEVDQVKEVDYLIGDDPHKQFWMSHRRERWGIVAYNPRTLMGALGLIREVLGRFVKSVFSGVSRKRSVQHADGTSA